MTRDLSQVPINLRNQSWDFVIYQRGKGKTNNVDELCIKKM